MDGRRALTEQLRVAEDDLLADHPGAAALYGRQRDRLLIRADELGAVVGPRGEEVETSAGLLVTRNGVGDGQYYRHRVICRAAEPWEGDRVRRRAADACSRILQIAYRPEDAAYGVRRGRARRYDDDPAVGWRRLGELRAGTDRKDE